ncbi:MAG: phosphopantetheine-binding protein [Thermoanaerobaculia bacterium]
MSAPAGAPATSEELAPRLKRLIVGTLRLEGLDPESIGDDQLLFGEGLGLDSIDALELVVAIEQEFAVAIPEGKVDHDVFHSVRTLALWLAERIALRDSQRETTAP